MRAMFLCGAVLGLAACGRKHTKRAEEPKVDLPPRSTAAAVEPLGPDSFTLALTSDGRILARGRAWSLEELDGLLQEVVRRERDAFYSSTVVRLRIDRSAPWLHVRWLAAALAKANADAARFVYSDGAHGEADIPCRIWPMSLMCLLPIPQETRCVYVRIAIGTDAKVHCGERTADDPAGVTEWMAEAGTRVRDERLSGIDAEIETQDTTPWGTVAAVYERLGAGGARHPWFSSGYVEAPADVRKLGRMPPPPSGPLASPPERGGMDVRADWGGRGTFEFLPREEANSEPEPEIPDDLEDK